MNDCMNERLPQNERELILRKANECVNGTREGQYGSPENNFSIISELWSAYVGTRIDAVDVSMMMILLKIARARSGNYVEDNFVDIAGYAACAGEIADGRR